MQQYLNLLKEIKEKGTNKPAAREGMPGTTSLFGAQFRHDLFRGFPLLTTKKMFWKGIVWELLWFLKGDTNIKFLIDNKVNIWNEDAYQYYLKLCKLQNIPNPYTFGAFIEAIKNKDKTKYPVVPENYILGDCGYQYGKVWRDWKYFDWGSEGGVTNGQVKSIDQISDLINGLRNNPEGRRHILTSIDPAHSEDLALFWCHALSQFNCRPLNYEQRSALLINGYLGEDKYVFTRDYKSTVEALEKFNIPKYYLDCQMYQRSADVFLGVPFNIASYALLTYILAKMCNMIPGEMVYTYGDVHIYDNHLSAVEEQLKREPKELPSLEMFNIGWNRHIDDIVTSLTNVSNVDEATLYMKNYNPDPSIKAELSTGLKK